MVLRVAERTAGGGRVRAGQNRERTEIQSDKPQGQRDGGDGQAVFLEKMPHDGFNRNRFLARNTRFVQDYKNGGLNTKKCASAAKRNYKQLIIIILSFSGGARW